MESGDKDNNVGKPARASRTVVRASLRPRKSPSRLSPSRISPNRRSPSRRSPGRRSPTRRSPARRAAARSPTASARKMVSRNLRIAQVSIPNIDLTKDDPIVDDPKTESEIVKKEENDAEPAPLKSFGRNPPSSVTRRSTRILSNMMKNEREQKLITMSRNFDRAASLPVDRSASLYDFGTTTKERGASMQRDRDLSKILHYEEEAIPDSSTPLEKGKKEIELISKPQEWGGWFGALCLIFVLPAAMIIPQISCFENHCDGKKLAIPMKFDSYLNFQAIGLYAGFLISLIVTSILPIGRLIDGQQNKIGRLQYRINGLSSAIFTIIALGVFEYKNYKISDYIVNSCLQLSVAGFIIGALFSIALYVKGGRAPISSLNMYGSTNNTVYDFWQGREVNPRIGSLDLKLFLLRAGIIGTLVVNSAVVAKTIQNADGFSTKDLNVAVLIAAGLHIFYCLDALVFEAASLTSFKIMYEGTGYMVCVGNLLHPFVATLGTRYLLRQKVQQSPYVLAAFVLTFLAGYVVYRMSNSQKDHFRKNPFSTAFSHSETIPTSRGKKILSSGLWGHVRHPNYLGDIVIHWSMALLALAKDPLPYYAAICCTLTLMYRALRDDARCRNRYGSAWEQYCLRVKSMILKRIF